MSDVLDVLYSASSKDRVSDEDLSFLLNYIEDTVYDDLGKVNELLLTADLDRLAPIFIVGLARFTYVLRNYLDHWQGYVTRSYKNLKGRGMDADELLQGLPVI